MVLSCDNNLHQKGKITMNREQVEKIARIKLPSDVFDIQSYGEKGIDTLILLRFSIHSKDMDLFINQSGLTLTENYKPFVNDFGTDLSWWEIDKMKKVSGAVQYFDDGLCRMAMIESTDSDLSTIYMVLQQ